MGLRLLCQLLAAEAVLNVLGAHTSAQRLAHRVDETAARARAVRLGHVGGGGGGVRGGAEELLRLVAKFHGQRFD